MQQKLSNAKRNKESTSRENANQWLKQISHSSQWAIVYDHHAAFAIGAATKTRHEVWQWWNGKLHNQVTCEFGCSRCLKFWVAAGGVFSPVVLCFDVLTAFICPPYRVFCFSRANFGWEPLDSQASPTLGCRGKPLQVQNFCRICICLDMSLVPVKKGCICSGKCLGHVDRHAIALLISYGRVEICVFCVFSDVRTFCLICTHLSSVFNSMLNKSSLTFRTADHAQGNFPRGALSNLFVEGRALQWFLRRLRRLPSPPTQHHFSIYMLRLAPCVQVMDELILLLVKTDVSHVLQEQSQKKPPRISMAMLDKALVKISHQNSFVVSCRILVTNSA